MVLLFCLIGDILLMFYIPTIPEYNNKLFLMIGGFSFFIARLVISVNFYIYPYRNKQIYISLNVRQFSVGLIISLVYTIFFSFFFTIKIENLVMRIMICFYILLTGFQLFSSIIRVNGFKEESLLPQLLGVLFTVCFNISDIILFWNIFLTPLRAGENVAICFYWLGMYLLTISIVRNKSYTIEKNDIFLI